MDRKALLPALVLLAFSTAPTQASANTADADVLRLHYEKPKATTVSKPDHRTVHPTPKGDHTASTKLGHR
jgi:hypothetical protein